MRTVLIATQNSGKVREFEHLFAPLGYQVKSLLDYPDLPDIPETGDSFLENATQKATTAAKWLHLPVIADDSGLCVQALGGRPGIYSARYAGLDKNNQANRQKLLKELENVPEGERQAYFVCTLAISDAEGQLIHHFEGRLEGEILREERGENGFGYDPIFYVASKGLTTAEMPEEEKNAISHRGNAMRTLAQALEAGEVTLS